MAGLAQERTETREILPVRFRFEMRFGLRKSLSLRASGITWHRYVMTCNLTFTFFLSSFRICVSHVHSYFFLFFYVIIFLIFIFILYFILFQKLN